MNGYDSRGGWTPPPYGPQEGKGSATASLVLGIICLILPIPIIGLILGIAGLASASSARKQGYEGGLRTAGLVCSVIGTIFAAITTLACTCGGCLMW